MNKNIIIFQNPDIKSLMTNAKTAVICHNEVVSSFVKNPPDNIDQNNNNATINKTNNKVCKTFFLVNTFFNS